MRGIACAGAIVVGLAIAGASLRKGDALPDAPTAPLVIPSDSMPIQTRRLEIIGDDGKVGMAYTVEGGTCYITVYDGGKARKIDMTKLARRL